MDGFPQFILGGYSLNVVVWLMIIFFSCVATGNIPPKISRRVRIALFLLILIPFALPAYLCLAGLWELAKVSVKFILYGDCE